MTPSRTRPRRFTQFTAKAGVEASVHYLPTDQAVPIIYNIDDEARAAYEAGSDSGWKNDRSLNLISIGIEIVNAPDGGRGRMAKYGRHFLSARLTR